MDIVVPSFGESITEGTLVEWLVGAGDSVLAGQALALIETDKVDTEIESPAGGVMDSLLVDAGVVVAAGTVIGTLSVDG